MLRHALADHVSDAQGQGDCAADDAHARRRLGEAAAFGRPARLRPMRHVAVAPRARRERQAGVRAARRRGRVRGGGVSALWARGRIAFECDGARRRRGRRAASLCLTHPGHCNHPRRARVPRPRLPHALRAQGPFAKRRQLRLGAARETQRQSRFRQSRRRRLAVDGDAAHGALVGRFARVQRTGGPRRRGLCGLAVQPGRRRRVRGRRRL
mmetsp:Transcript_28014/g.94350  ORF Transcript_28014/g.94350 Transcript_28014/m.94350 type:complete len:211 (-) Transcript_28014:412-1044(-)